MLFVVKELESPVPGACVAQTYSRVESPHRSSKAPHNCSSPCAAPQCPSPISANTRDPFCHKKGEAHDPCLNPNEAKGHSLALLSGGWGVVTSKGL